MLSLMWPATCPNMLKGLSEKPNGVACFEKPNGVACFVRLTYTRSCIAEPLFLVQFIQVQVIKLIG